MWWQFCFRQLLTQGATRVHFFGKLTTPNRAQQSDITVSDKCTRRREAPAHLFGYAQQLCSHLRNNEAVKMGERNMQSKKMCKCHEEETDNRGKCN